MRYTYEHARPAVTVDVVIFAMRAGDLAVLLIRRAHAPFKGEWALPGGFVNENEPLEWAAARELNEETGIRDLPIEQLGAFGDPGRDPRGHTISVVYYTFAVAESRPVVAGDDASEAAWHPLRSLPVTQVGRHRPSVKLAFDHARIIDVARARLQERLNQPNRPAIFDLVPSRFTLSELQRVYEAVLGRELDKRNFRARLLRHEWVEPASQGAGGTRRTGPHRPAQLYRWKTPKRVR